MNYSDKIDFRNGERVSVFTKVLKELSVISDSGFISFGCKYNIRN